METENTPVETTEAEEPQEVEATESDAPEAEDKPEDWRNDFDAEKALEKIRKQNSELKNLRARAKQAEEKAAGVEEKDSRLKQLEADLLRERVGRKLGLPDELVDRLRGSSEEEMLADAEKLVELLSPRRPVSQKPVETLRGGGDPDREPEETDLSKIASRMFSH